MSDKKRKAEAEHPEDIKREHEKAVSNRRDGRQWVRRGGSTKKNREDLECRRSRSNSVRGDSRRSLERIQPQRRGSTACKSMQKVTEFVRGRLVARGLDLYAAMPPLETKRTLFADVARTHRARRICEVKLTFVDVKKDVHVSTPDTTKTTKHGSRYGMLRRWGAA